MGWEKILHQAVASNDLEQVKELIAKDEVLEGLKKDVWYPGILQSPIHQAAYLGLNDILETLLEAGANPNSFVHYPGRPPNKFTVLHGAVMCGHMSTVDLLLAHGADTTMKGKFSDYIYNLDQWEKYDGTPLDFAKAKNNEKIVARIEQHNLEHGVREQSPCPCSIM